MIINKKLNNIACIETKQYICIVESSLHNNIILIPEELETTTSFFSGFLFKKNMQYYKNLDLKNITYIDTEGLSRIESWKDIPNYNGAYLASDLGRIKSNMPHNGTLQRILRQHTTKKGYLGCGLYKNKKRKSCQSHRIIAETYIPNPLNLPEVNHKFGIKDDNRPCQLEWSTHEDNIDHAVEHSLMQKGEIHSNAKLTEKNVLEIRSSIYSVEYLANHYNVSKNTIWQVKRKAIIKTKKIYVHG